MPLTGIVITFLPDTGFGFIQTDDAWGPSIRFHINQCDAASLSEGDKVTFDKLWDDPSPCSPAVNVEVVSKLVNGIRKLVVPDLGLKRKCPQP